MVSFAGKPTPFLVDACDYHFAETDLSVGSVQVALKKKIFRLMCLWQATDCFDKASAIYFIFFIDSSKIQELQKKKVDSDPEVGNKIQQRMKRKEDAPPPSNRRGNHKLCDVGVILLHEPLCCGNFHSSILSFFF